MVVALVQLLQRGGFVAVSAVDVVGLLYGVVLPSDGMRYVESRPCLPCAVALGSWRLSVVGHGEGATELCQSLSSRYGGTCLMPGGRNPSASSCWMNTAMDLVPFLLLQAPHNSCRFSKMSCPPWLSAMMWS